MYINKKNYCHELGYSDKILKKTILKIIGLSYFIFEINLYLLFTKDIHLILKTLKSKILELLITSLLFLRLM